MSRNYPARQPMAVPMGSKQKKPSRSGLGLAILILVAIFIVLLMLLGVIPSPFYDDPTATPLPPTATFALVLPDENTPEPGIEASPSAVLTQQPGPTSTPRPSATPTPTVTPTITPTPTEQPMAFVIRSVEYLPNAVLFPSYDCEEYYFIGGEVWDFQEAPVYAVKVILGGTYGGEAVNFTSYSGDEPVYGESGFGFALPNKLIQDTNMFLQLLGSNDQPLSARTYLEVSGSCAGNLLVVTYKQTRPYEN